MIFLPAMVILRKRLAWNCSFFLIFCINEKTLIVSMQNISLYFGKVTQDESILNVFRNEAYLIFPMFSFRWLIYSDLSSTNWLNCSSVNACTFLNYNELDIIIAAVTNFLCFPKQWDLINFISVPGRHSFLVNHPVDENLGDLERLGKQFYLKSFWRSTRLA